MDDELIKKLPEWIIILRDIAKEILEKVEKEDPEKFEMLKKID